MLERSVFLLVIQCSRKADQAFWCISFKLFQAAKKSSIASRSNSMQCSANVLPMLLFSMPGRSRSASASVRAWSSSWPRSCADCRDMSRWEIEEIDVAKRCNDRVNDDTSHGYLRYLWTEAAAAKINAIIPVPFCNVFLTLFAFRVGLKGCENGFQVPNWPCRSALSSWRRRPLNCTQLSWFSILMQFANFSSILQIS